MSSTQHIKKFCEEHVIEHEVTALYTPHHNGLAERRNRNLLDMTRSTLKEKSLPKQLWGEAIGTSVSELNKCPIKKLKEVVPIDKWTRRYQGVIHFKVFGSVCYKHIPDATRRKLDDISKVVLLIGYRSTSAYKLYCPITNKVEVDKYVIVKESETWDWGKSQSNSIAVLTLESDSTSEGDSASEGDSDFEGESESEDDFNSDSESESEVDFNFEGDSDSNDGSSSEGNPTSKGNPLSEGVLASEGGPASEGL